MEELQIQSSQTPAGTCVIRLSGPLTLRTLFDFQDAARKETSAPLIVDLTEVPYIDSAGLGSILGVFASCQRAARRFAVAGAGERLQTLFEITHVQDVLPIFETVDGAEQGFTKSAGA